MKQKPLIELAERLTQARLTKTPIVQLSTEHELTRSDAYSIQEEGLRHREQKGEVLIGYKMGLTSEAKRRQMNLDAPLYGVLTDKMQLQSGGVFPLDRGIHPKIEPEVAFLLKKDLSGSPTREEMIDALEAVAAGLEILDSRYTQFKYFSMEDVISDNSSSSHFVLGEWNRDFQKLALDNLALEMKVNQKLATSGSTKAISGDPLLSLKQQCELLSERGLGLKKGMIVLAGAATEAFHLEPGLEISLVVEGLAPLSIRTP